MPESAASPLKLRATPERISNPQNPYGMSKLGQEMVAINLGRRYDIPTVALRYSIVQGPRQSVYNAYSGACRIFCLSYLRKHAADRLRGQAAQIRDYVNIDDVDGRQRACAHRRPSHRAGCSTLAAAQAVTTMGSSRRHRPTPVRLRTGGRGHRRVPLRRHPAHHLRHQRPGGAWAGSRSSASSRPRSLRTRRGWRG